VYVLCKQTFVHTIMSDYRITKTIEEAAAEVRKTSFAIYQVPCKTGRSIRDAWREGVKVLNRSPPQNGSNHNHSVADTDQWTRIVKGSLYGYNEPSPAKRLFRAFPASSDQPWPSETFRQVSIEVAEQLQGILLDCHEYLQESVNRTSAQTPQTSNSAIKQEQRPTSPGVVISRKRRRFEASSSSLSTTSLPVRLDAKNCPLDYFLYHNQHPDTPNCTAHVDRGLLIAVCLTDVPGLEILSPHYLESENSTKSKWICPELAIHNSKLYSEAGDCSASNLICIMAGGQLAQSLGEDIPACVHRVRDKLKRSRLSISYELRIK